MPNQPTPVNGTMFQAFEWYIEPDGKHWRRLTRDLAALAELGITAIWIPPACKAQNDQDMGYGIYDLWDLGEFDQHGRRTKWGTVEELRNLAKVVADNNVLLYHDAVLNHKASADHAEQCRAIQCDWNNRLQTIGDVREIGAWVGFEFPGRGNTYSDMKWNWDHFTGVDWDENTKQSAIFRLLGDNKFWARSVSREYGNYDYLMFADIDHSHPQVRDEIKKWAVWLCQQLNLGGIRFDAVKHFSEDFLIELIEYLTKNVHENLFFVGEFWENSVPDMSAYLSRMPRQFSLFDCELVYAFSRVSYAVSADLTHIFDGTLTASDPIQSVTLVQNHDTQPGQKLSAPINDWFNPLAYAMILLRAEGYPCVFYGHLYGISGPNGFVPPICGGQLGDFILARKLYAYGQQDNYFDYPTCIGWVRRGTWDRKYGCAVVLSNAGAGWKRMYVGTEHKGEIWTDLLGWNPTRVTIGDDGFGEFHCNAISVSIYAKEDAAGRNLFGKSKGIFHVQID